MLSVPTASRSPGPFPLTAAFALLCLLACGNGSGSGEARNPPVRPTPAGSPTVGGPAVSTPVPGTTPGTVPGTVTGTPTPTATPDVARGKTFRFTYPSVAGEITGIAHSDGRMAITRWPNRFAPTVRLRPGSSRIDDASCASTAVTAGHAANAVDARLRAAALQVVRSMSTFLLDVEYVPVLSVAFQDAARDAARAALPGVTAFTLVGLPALDAPRVSLRLADDAITRVTGSVEDLQDEVATSLLGGRFGLAQGETMAADLACDLRAGKATLVFEFTLDGDDARAEATGLEPTP